MGKKIGIGLFILALVLMMIFPVIALGIVGSIAGGNSACTPSGDVTAAQPSPGGSVGNIGPIPGKFIPLYQGAAAQFGLGPDGPSMLAGIHNAETSFSTNIATSGPYQGPMAFTVSGWGTLGVDGNGDGKKDIMNDADAIYAAAKLLKSFGAPKNWRDDLASYNAGPANKAAGYGYADGVMAFAKQHHVPDTGGGTVTGGGNPAGCAPSGGVGGYVSPLTKDVIDKCSPGRSDMGVDIECDASTVGQPIVAMGDGTVLHIQDMGAFGPTWMTYKLNSGPFKDKVIFVGHSGPPLVKETDTVTAGQPIIKIHGYGASPGHIEIGWGNKDGSNTLASPHYSEGDITNEGQSFRVWLNQINNNKWGGWPSPKDSAGLTHPSPESQGL
jgi:hypothetical protein